MLVALFTLVFAGCADLKLGPAPTKPPPPAQVVAQSPSTEPAVKSPEADKEESTLAAVEEFLDRTKQYRVGAIPANPPPNPADDVPVTVTKDPPRPKPSPDQTVANAQVTLDDPAPAKPMQAIPAVESVRIRAADAPATKSTSPPTQHATNTALEARSDDLGGVADKLLKALETQVKDRPGFESEWRLRMAQLALDRDPTEFSLSKDMSEPARQLLLAFLDIAQHVRKLGGDPHALSTAALESTDQMRMQLRSRGEPTIRAVAMCRKVVTFGVYDEMTEEDFLAGRSIQTIVYSELSNLSYEKSGDGLHETRLSTRLEVFNAAGDSVWQRDEPEVTDRCRRPRNDFFLAQRITLPPTLPAGEYTLKVSVEDRIAARADETKLNFSINAPVSVATKKAATKP